MAAWQSTAASSFSCFVWALNLNLTSFDLKCKGKHHGNKNFFIMLKIHSWYVKLLLINQYSNYFLVMASFSFHFQHAQTYSSWGLLITDVWRSRLPPPFNRVKHCKVQEKETLRDVCCLCKDMNESQTGCTHVLHPNWLHPRAFPPQNALSCCMANDQ